MESMFAALIELIKSPLRHDRGVKTDSSILLIYPPDRELDFRERLLDTFVPELDAKGIPHRLLDLTGFMFTGLSEEQVKSLQEDEFDDYRWMLQGLSKRVEASFHATFTDLARQNAGGNLIAYGTGALYPLVRFGEILRQRRRIAVVCGHRAAGVDGDDVGAGPGQSDAVRATLAAGSTRHVGDFAGQREIGSGHRLRVRKVQPPRGRVSVNSSTTLIAPYGPSTA